MESLNLLFVKNQDIDSYDFVHQSFKEYFVAEYLINQFVKKINSEFELGYSINFQEIIELIESYDYDVISFFTEFIMRTLLSCDVG